MAKSNHKSVGNTINLALLVVAGIALLSANHPAWASKLFVLAGAISLATLSYIAVVKRNRWQKELEGLKGSVDGSTRQPSSNSSEKISEKDLLERIYSSISEKIQPAAYDKILEQVNHSYLSTELLDARNEEDFAFTLNVINVYISGRNKARYIDQNKKVECVIFPELTHSMYQNQPHLH